MREIFFACLRSGLPVSAAGFAAAVLLAVYADLPRGMLAAAGALPLLAGCFSAGYAAGRRGRHGGLRCGAGAALLLCACWYAAACWMLHQLRSPALFVTAIPAGCLGGVCGVTTALPVPHRRSHLPERLRTSFALLLRHRPPHISPDE